MATYIHITDNCKEAAQKYGVLEQLRRIQRETEAEQKPASFNARDRIRWKRIRRALRLFGYQYQFDVDELIVCLDILKRDNKNYDRFTNEPEFFKHRLSPPPSSAITPHYTTRSSSPRTPIRQPLNDAEKAWLWQNQSSKNTGDYIALETQYWVDMIRNEENRGELGSYRRLLSKLSETVQDDKGFHITWDEDDTDRNIGIAYISHPSSNKLLLLGPLSSRTDEEYIRSEYSELIHSNMIDPGILTRSAVRSYPLFMVLDSVAWNTIQRGREANLALSPEESEILTSVRVFGSTEHDGYPLFINGRAGSGKSTILQYLAADYVRLALTNDKFDPLYLTSSKELLERSRQTVNDILIAHHDNVLDMSRQSDRRYLDELLGRSFKLFRKFLLSYVPEKERGVMLDQHYVGYTRFLKLWSEHVARSHTMRQLSPAVSWHVIRSYIKGRRLDRGDEFDLDDYRAHDSKGRSVSEETFRKIFDLVWDGWYREMCETNGLWDDQDLAVVALENLDLAPQNIGAVFCDEAQDFTTLELRIISKISAFSRRVLERQELSRIPIVFAGDPLQTINPTGFRWDAVRADFHAEVCDNFDGRRRGSVLMKYRELSFNYRSNKSIVKFCNLIQLLRSATLGRGSIKPQMSWALGGEAVPVVRFSTDKPETIQSLHDHLDFVKIVNCYEGEETAFVESDPALKEIATPTDGVYRNFFSPMRAKGLEFPSVVIYGFGSQIRNVLPKGLMDAIRNRHTLSDSRLIELDHFFNRLYVAASRAKEQLIVVDTIDGFESFWNFASDQVVIDEAWKMVGWTTQRDDTIESLSDGSAGAWKGEFVDPVEQGKSYARQGRLTSDSYMLRQASLAYRRADRGFDADVCLAEAAMFDEKWADAGQRFEEIKEDRRAFDCYWKAQSWRRLSDLGTGNPEIASDPRVWAADVMRKALDVDGDVSKRVCTAAADQKWLDDARRDGTWQSVFRYLARHFAKESDRPDIEWLQLDRVYAQFDRSATICSSSDLAEVAYSAREFKRAHQLWSAEKKPPEHDRFKRARACCTEFPDNIGDLEALEEYEEMISQWLEHGERIVSGGSLKMADASSLIDAALNTGNLAVAVGLLKTFPEAGHAVEALCSAIATNDVQHAWLMSAQMSAELVRSGRLSDAMAIAEGRDYSVILGSESDQSVRSGFREMGASFAALYSVVSEMSHSDRLEMESPIVQKNVSQFVQRHFAGKGSSLSRQLDRVKLNVDWEVVGRIIECTRDFVGAVKHYDYVIASAKSESDRHLARQRKIICREQFAEATKSSNRSEANRQRRLALRERESYGLVGVSISAVPKATKSGDKIELEVRDAAARFRAAGLQPGSSVGTPTERKIDPFVIRWSPVHRKLRVEHGELFESVSINKDGLQGDTKISRPRKIGRSGQSWRLPAWNATVELRTIGDKMRIRLSVKGRDIFRDTF